MTELDKFKILLVAAYWCFWGISLFALGYRVSRNSQQSVVGQFDFSTQPLVLRLLGVAAMIALLFTMAYSFIFLIYPHIQYEYLPIETLQLSIITYIGALFMALGLGLQIIGQVSLGLSYRLLLPQGEIELITHGIYKLTRNPVYLGSSLSLFGLFLVLPGAVLLFAWLLIIINNHYRILVEEQDLLQRFGDAYRQYQNKVRRYL